MIFIIAAVLTLIISFVVALNSLIREQNKQMGSGGKGQPPEPAVGDMPVLQVSQPVAQTLDTQMVQNKLPSEKAVDKDTNLSKEPFFWELEQQGQDEIEEAESIEKVQQQLAAYKSQKQRQDNRQGEENFVKDKAVKNKLSGEFSLSDLK